MIRCNGTTSCVGNLTCTPWARFRKDCLFDDCALRVAAATTGALLPKSKTPELIECCDSLLTGYSLFLDFVTLWSSCCDAT